jgi:NAD(P)-dependent dehydrogenase (short-subunit alcohol dehydrogenase family)
MSGEPDIPLTPPSRSLAGKVAIVTGAGCAGEGIGNGRAITILLAADGADVLALDLNLEWAQKTAEIANSVPGRGRVIAVKSDVTNAQDAEAAVQKALDEFGRLDILINNVGIGGAPGTAVSVDMAAWAKGLEINVSSMVLMAKYAVPAMARNAGESKGSIVNMGSVAGLKGGTPHLLYPTSKGAIVNMTRAMAAHHAADGIRVNCVCPGVSLSESDMGCAGGESGHGWRESLSFVREAAGASDGDRAGDDACCDVCWEDAETDSESEFEYDNDESESDATPPPPATSSFDLIASTAAAALMMR